MRLGVDRGTHLGQRTGAAPNRPDTRTLSHQIRIFFPYPLHRRGRPHTPYGLVQGDFQPLPAPDPLDPFVVEPTTRRPQERRRPAAAHGRGHFARVGTRRAAAGHPGPQAPGEIQPKHSPSTKP